MAKKSALGRGLGALIKQSETEVADRVSATGIIDIRKLEVNPFQPRKHFDKEAIEELAASIKQLGIIQPITVREIEEDKYQIISGERRYRASLIAGLTEVPAYIRHADDSSMLEMAIVENIQRENLDAIEVATGYQQLIDECRWTQENVGERVGKKRSTVANYLRLLKLPAEIQLAIRHRALSMGHARALVNIEDVEQQLNFLRNIVEDGMSVRQLESAIRQINQPESELVSSEPESPKINTEEPVIDAPKQTSEPAEIDANTEAKQSDNEQSDNDVLIYEDTQPTAYMPEIENEQFIKERLSKCFGAGVDLKRNATGSGKVVISFRTDAELQYILQAAEKMHELNP